MIKIAVFVNLLLAHKTQKQAYLSLLYLRDLTEDNEYIINPDDITSKRLERFFSKQKGDVFSNIKVQPLKGQWNVISYLKDKGFLEKTSSQNYKITNLGLDKVSELENINLTIFKIFSFLGATGGLAYLIKIATFFLEKLEPLISSVQSKIL